MGIMGIMAPLVYIYIYTSLQRKFAVHMHCKLPLTSILRSYICGIHCVTMIYMLHMVRWLHNHRILRIARRSDIMYKRPLSEKWRHFGNIWPSHTKKSVCCSLTRLYIIHITPPVRIWLINLYMNIRPTMALCACGSCLQISHIPLCRYYN